MTVERFESGSDCGGNGCRGKTRKWYFAFGYASKMTVVWAFAKSNTDAGRDEAGSARVAYVRKALSEFRDMREGRGNLTRSEEFDRGIVDTIVDEVEPDGTSVGVVSSAASVCGFLSVGLIATSGMGRSGEGRGEVEAEETQPPIV